MEQYGFQYHDSYERPSINRRICRQFLNGSCRFGSRCHYLHELPSVLPPTSQICRYFQKGGCWFGDGCRYLHVTAPEAASAGLSRRGSAPVVHTPWVGHALPERRGSEPSLLQAQGFYSQGRRGAESMQTYVAHPQHNFGRQNTDITEEDVAEGSSQTSPHRRAESSHAHVPEPQASVQQCPETSAQTTVPSSTLSAQAGEWRPLVNQQEPSSLEVAAEHGAASATAAFQTAQEHTEFFNQSKDVTCGICMETVYEKTSAEERRFGILPNCSHPFCLSCIVTWRKTKNFHEEVIKSCPQCRVKSAFYVPNKYWVEGQPKETLIRNFKAKCSKRRCSFFMRHGCCPFKTECLYWHDLPHGYRPPRRRRSAHSHHAMSLDDLGSLQLLDYVIAMTLLDDLLDDEDEDEFPLYLSEYDDYDLF
ncbi:makorin, ring finger protein, 4 isoform X2 [Oncorhynchus tshawytscha]|uniref:RING-type E3 ubiquitin transferase n=1 Tax=Oncorhynchus tshawytscha TaxID=74940 RepID=A0A8C8HPL6_ONCTS|nr:makorin, ring finger protein, 4 isoform X2 [Oncorhynchus tshawytscha]